MTEDQAFGNFIGHLILDNRTLTADVLDEIHALYPANDSANGAPFSTGDSLFDRAEAWYTVNMYLAPRRLFFDKAAGLSSQPFFAYFFDELIPGNDPTLGGELRFTAGLHDRSFNMVQYSMGLSWRFYSAQYRTPSRMTSPIR